MHSSIGKESGAGFINTYMAKYKPSFIKHTELLVIFTCVYEEPLKNNH